MLTPPLSHLSAELLFGIVTKVAQLPFGIGHLRNLSLADRAFTQHCQFYIFRVLSLVGTRIKISHQLERLRTLLDDKPSIAQRVRTVHIHFSEDKNAWLLEDATFNTVLHWLSVTPNPPHKLHLRGPLSYPVEIELPILFMECLERSFFSQTLVILHLQHCRRIPLSIFHFCHRLKHVLLDAIESTAEDYNGRLNTQVSIRETPALEYLDFRDAHTTVKYMLQPPLGFQGPIADLSQLHTLTLSPHEEAEMKYLQPILSAATATLEELYLTHPRVGTGRAHGVFK